MARLAKRYNDKDVATGNTSAHKTHCYCRIWTCT